MPVDNVSAVFISQTGNLWFSPSNQGLIKKNGDDWVLFNTENSDIPGNFVLCMTESADAVLWVAFSNGSIATTTDGSSWDIIKHEEAKDFPNSNASSMLLDAQGKIWISFENGGIAGFNGTDWVFHTALTTPLPSDYITNMVLDSNGDIWISSFQDGLSIFDPDFGAGIDDDIWTENTRTYPNPVQNYLTVESKTLSSNAYVIVYNVMGQILMQEALVDLKQNIDCQGLSNGFYTYQIIQEKMITSGVFIKK
ncbi:MAG: hypothetical protein B7C24_00270 [Bacteroidetes bacterium 4572_77]|nr:MAG: hypothetical protein B7C24_00270 [Bacteroidetes bacterium 4572_77]